MTTYRAYNTNASDHMVSHVSMRKHSKKLKRKCYIQMKSKVIVQGHHSPLAPVIPYKAQRNSQSPNIVNLFTSEGIQINEENIN